MGAASLASGEALVDAISVGLVCDDENTAVGRCSGCREEGHADQNSGDDSHRAPGTEKIVAASHDDAGRFHEEMRRLWGRALTRQPLVFHALSMNGLLAISGICREIMR